MPAVRIYIADVIRAAAEIGDLTQEDIIGRMKIRGVVYWRQCAYVAALRFTGQSLSECARRFGNRNHATLIFATKKVTPEFAADAMAIGARAIEIAETREALKVAA